MEKAKTPKKQAAFVEQLRSVMRPTSMSITDAAAGPPADLPDTAHLPDDLATLKNMILELVVTLRAERRDREALQQRLSLLVQRLFGRKSERFDPNQLLLFTEDSACAGGCGCRARDSRGGRGPAP